jgi:hypothetical protein
VRLAAVLLVLGVTMLVGLAAVPAATGESPWLALVFQRRWLDGVFLTVGALAPIGVAGLALFGRELLRFPAAIAVAGFALVAIKFRAWDILRAFGDASTATRMIGVAALLGTVVATAGLVRSART